MGYKETKEEAGNGTKKVHKQEAKSMEGEKKNNFVKLMTYKHHWMISCRT